MARQSASPEFLIISSSARFIAQSAAACGYALSTIDGFADAEVRSLSHCAERVPLVDGSLSVAHVRRVCERLLCERHIAGVIVGPGLDAHPRFIDWLSARATVYANHADVFSSCRDRRRFAGLLDHLGISRPPEGRDAPSPVLSKVAGAAGGAHVHFAPSGRRDRRRFAGLLDHLGISRPPEGRDAPSPVLSKVAGAAGGAHVHFAPSGRRGRRRFAGTLDRLDLPRPRESRDAPLPAPSKVAGAAPVRFTKGAITAYRQSYLPGIARSYLFLANGTRVRSIGWNTQWQSRHDENHPFCYGGALNRSVPDPVADSRVADYAQRLTRALSLVGINSIDYVVAGGEVYLLELNPRISATMQLHDADGALFAAHLDACASGSFRPLIPAEPRAHAVLYAPYPIKLPDRFRWPASACDLPERSCFSMGDPVCTLLSAASTPASTLTGLQRDIRWMSAQFTASRNTGGMDAEPVSNGKIVA